MRVEGIKYINTKEQPLTGEKITIRPSRSGDNPMGLYNKTVHKLRPTCEGGEE